MHLIEYGALPERLLSEIVRSESHVVRLGVEVESSRTRHVPSLPTHSTWTEDGTVLASPNFLSEKFQLRLKVPNMINIDSPPVSVQGSPPAFFTASRPSSHHSQTVRPQRRLPCSLHTYSRCTRSICCQRRLPGSLKSLFTPFTDCFVVNASFLAASRVKNVFQPQDQINLKILVKRTGIAVALPIKLKV
jgi:hypothetical protein